MPAARPGFWSTVTRFDATQLSPVLGFRNALGVASSLVAGMLLANPAAGVMAASGALNVAFSDGTDPYSHRGRRMFAAAFFVSLAVFTGRLTGHNHPLAILLEAGCAFIAGLLIAAGGPPGDIGAITLVTFIVYAGSPSNSLDNALNSGLLALGGALLQTAVSLASWPLNRYRPEARALAQLYEDLARSTAAGISADEAPPTTASILTARAALVTLTRSRSLEAERYLALFSQAERIRLALLALSHLQVRLAREASAITDSQLLASALSLAESVLRSIGEALDAGVKGATHTESMLHLHAISDHLRIPSREPSLEAMRNEARKQLDALTGQLASAVELAAHTSRSGLKEFDRREAAQPWHLRLAGTYAMLRANLTLDSPAFRHALRLAVCVAIADALTRILGWHRAYWAAMTVAIVLKPDFSTTFSRGVLRLAGTFAGLALATALFRFLSPTLTLQALLIVFFMFAMRWAGPANYGVFVAALTAMVVLLFAVAGIAPSDVIAARAINTVAGGVIALAAYRLWPTWERTQVPEALARLFDAYRVYFQAVRDAYLQPGLERDPAFVDRIDRARQACRLARTHLEASAARLTLEPGVPTDRITALQAILANSHRFIHAVMALEAGVLRSPAVPARPAFRTFSNDVDFTLYFLAAYLRGVTVQPGDLPDLREDHRALIQTDAPPAARYELVNVESDRVTNSVNTLTVELLQWVGNGKSATASGQAAS
jgi:uncharacterized membrane protein YccC